MTTETTQTAPDPGARIAQLEAEQRELVFPRFDQRDAFELGTLLAQEALRQQHPVAVDIRRLGLILYRAALPGSTPDQESWIAGKSAVVLRLESSSALIAARLDAAGFDATQGWLPRPEYALTGGSVPVVVDGVGVVAAVTASGLSSDDDHALVVSAMRAFLAR